MQILLDLLQEWGIILLKLTDLELHKDNLMVRDLYKMSDSPFAYRIQMLLFLHDPAANLGITLSHPDHLMREPMIAYLGGESLFGRTL